MPPSHKEGLQSLASGDFGIVGHIVQDDGYGIQPSHPSILLMRRNLGLPVDDGLQV
jgi:hypothetical protein